MSQMPLLVIPLNKETVFVETYPWKRILENALISVALVQDIRLKWQMSVNNGSVRNKDKWTRLTLELVIKIPSIYMKLLRH